MTAALGSPYSVPIHSAVVEITNRCNLRCVHCASNSGASRPGEMSLEEFARLFADIKALGCEKVTVIGGEALMRDDWFDICKSVLDAGMGLSLISNGIRIISEDVFSQLKALSPHVIGISLDGATRETYRKIRGVDRFDHLLSLLHRLLADGHEHVNAITTFSRDNLHEFDAFADLLDGTGITWQVQLAHQGGERFDNGQFLSINDYARFVQKMTDTFVNRPTVRLRPMDDFGYCPMDPRLKFLHQTWKGCMAGRQIIGVRSDGGILGCLSLGDNFIEANVKDVPLKDIWQSGRYFERFRNKAAYLKGACRACPFGNDCRAGCTAVAVSATSDIGENPYCIRALETKSVLADALDFSE